MVVNRAVTLADSVLLLFMGKAWLLIAFFRAQVLKQGCRLQSDKPARLHSAFSCARITRLTEAQLYMSVAAVLRSVPHAAPTLQSDWDRSAMVQPDATAGPVAAGPLAQPTTPLKIWQRRQT